MKKSIGRVRCGDNAIEHANHAKPVRFPGVTGDSRDGTPESEVPFQDIRENAVRADHRSPESWLQCRLNGAQFVDELQDSGIFNKEDMILISDKELARLSYAEAPKMVTQSIPGPKTRKYLNGLSS